MAEVIKVEFPFSSYFHVFLLFEKISETEEMDGLALRMGQRCQIRLVHRIAPVCTNGIALLSAGCSMTHGKCLGCHRPLLGGQVYIAQRFATQLIQAKKPRISQAAELKLTLTDRKKKKSKKKPNQKTQLGGVQWGHYIRLTAGVQGEDRKKLFSS